MGNAKRWHLDPVKDTQTGMVLSQKASTQNPNLDDRDN
jgi:hypothetical protein